MCPIRIPGEPDYIEYLVRKKYPLAPHLNYHMGGLTPESRQRLTEQVAAYRKQLGEKTKFELKTMYDRDVEEQRAEQEKQRFFNLKDAEADFDHWSKASYWTLEEGVALIFGKNPKVVSQSSMTSFEKNDGWGAYHSPFAKQYKNIMDLAQRAKVCQHIFDANLPKLFLEWAEKNDIPVPAALKEKVVARHGNLVNWKKLYDDLRAERDKMVEEVNEAFVKKNTHIDALEQAIETLKAAPPPEPKSKPLPTKERLTALKLIVGMAVDQYGYDGNASKNTAPAQIADDLAGHGITVDEDTVRKWLKEGWETVVPQKPADKSA